MDNNSWNRLEGKIDRLDMRLDAIDITLVKQNEQLAYHIKRTNLLETQVQPVVDHVTFVKVLVKALGVLALVVGILKALSLI